MDLFTYLLGKKGINSSVHGDLFSYLLGKGQSQIYTISGTTIYIPNAKKLVSFMMTKESTQDGTPTPDNPVPVNVVEGYRNLLDLQNGTTSNEIIATINNGEIILNGTTTAVRLLTIGLENNLNLINGNQYTISVNNSVANSNIRLRIDSAGNYDCILSNINSSKTITHSSNIDYFNDKIQIRVASGVTLNNFKIKPQIVEGDQELPYVPYGNNYIAVNVSDGTNTNSVQLPLNGNEIVGIGDYKDELKVDKSGHVFINKKTKKVVLDGSEESLATQRSTSPYVYRVTINDYLREASLDISLCNYYQATSNGTYNSLVTNQCRFRYASGDTNNYFYICDAQQSSLADFKTWLSTHNTEVYYVLATPELIDLQTTVDLKLFKGANTITNSEDGDMTIQYR
jgi:hypothetical protein